MVRAFISIAHRFSIPTSRRLSSNTANSSLAISANRFYAVTIPSSHYPPPAVFLALFSMTVWEGCRALEADLLFSLVFFCTQAVTAMGYATPWYTFCPESAPVSPRPRCFWLSFCEVQRVVERPSRKCSSPPSCCPPGLIQQCRVYKLFFVAKVHRC